MLMRVRDRLLVRPQAKVPIERLEDLTARLVTDISQKSVC